MKTEQTEELFVKWMDGALTPEEDRELASLFAEDPGIKEELVAIKSVTSRVAQEVPASVEPPYGDFFNSQLMRKIDLTKEARRPARRAGEWWRSLGWAWAPVGVLALVLSFFAGHRLANSGRAERLVAGPPGPVESISLPTVYSVGDSLDAEVIADADGQVAAIVVNGIAAIRDDIDFGSVTSLEQLPQGYLSAEARRFD